MSTESTSSRPALIAPNSIATKRTQPSSHPPNQNRSPGESAAKKRTSHACDRCRMMRAKCSGGTRCTRCIKDDAVCAYGDHKRERNRKDLVENYHRIKELEDENRDLVSALRQVTSDTSFRPSEHPSVMKMLAKYTNEDRSTEPLSSQSRSLSIQSPVTSLENKSDKAGEEKVSSVIGSPGRQGELSKDVDIDHGIGASGFIGKMSEMSWMQRCREYLIDQKRSGSSNVLSPELSLHTNDTSALTYFMDDCDLLAVDEDHVDALQWPPSPYSIIFAEAYFYTVQGAFQLLVREKFLESMYNWPDKTPFPSWPQRRWLALANLVWAIGAKWLELSQLVEEEPSESHLVYYARARALGIDHRIAFDHPDIDMVQGIGLLAFYLLLNGSISRAWNTIGNAVRHAMTLGLHLKVSDPSISHTDQNRRARIWFSLYKLQMLIAETTGRPPLVRTTHVTVPLEILESPPTNQPFTNANTGADTVNLEPSFTASRIWLEFLSSRKNSKQKTNTALQYGMEIPQGVFIHVIRLCQLNEEVSELLYTGCQDIPWSEIQRKIESLQQALDVWKKSLPEEFRLRSDQPANLKSCANIQLAMYCHSVTMIIHRPCLCEIHISNESDQSKQFNISSARACVNAAMSMIDLMPDEFIASDIYQMLPWWTLLHYLCQAAAVMMLELCLDAQHFQGQGEKVIKVTVKAISYLGFLGTKSMSAYQARRIFESLLKRVSARFGDLSDLVSQIEPAPQPSGWSQNDEAALLASLKMIES